MPCFMIVDFLGIFTYIFILHLDDVVMEETVSRLLYFSLACNIQVDSRYLEFAYLE